MGWAGDWGELEGRAEGMTNIIIVIINIVIVIVNVIVSSSSLGKVEGQPGGMTSLGWQCHLWGYCLLAQLDGAGVQWIKNNQGRNNKEQGEASGNVLRPSTFLVVAKKNAVFPGLKIFRRHVGREEMNLIILWAKTKSGVAIGKLTKHQNKKKKNKCSSGFWLEPACGVQIVTLSVWLRLNWHAEPGDRPQGGHDSKTHT